MAAKFPAKSQDLPYQKAPPWGQESLSLAKGSHSGGAAEQREAERARTLKKINPTIKGVHHDFRYYGRNAR